MERKALFLEYEVFGGEPTASLRNITDINLDLLVEVFGRSYIFLNLENSFLKGSDLRGDVEINVEVPALMKDPSPYERSYQLSNYSINGVYSKPITKIEEDLVKKSWLKNLTERGCLILNTPLEMRIQNSTPANGVEPRSVYWKLRLKDHSQEAMERAALIVKDFESAVSDFYAQYSKPAKPNAIAVSQR